MESYEIEFQPSVRKDFRKLSPDNASRILPRLEELAKDPFPPQSIKLKGAIDYIKLGLVITEYS
jgi:mRNA-degrading endonuclease RelE of RelBE toxin-antitoxin system